MSMKWRLHYWSLLAITIIALPFMVVLWVALFLVGLVPGLYRWRTGK